VKRLEKIRTVLAKRTANEKGGAEKLASCWPRSASKLKRKSGENDQLFGSSLPLTSSEALAAQGFNIDKRKIELADPIKLIGEYQVTAKLYQDVAAAIKVVVERGDLARRPSTRGLSGDTPASPIVSEQFFLSEFALLLLRFPHARDFLTSHSSPQYAQVVRLTAASWRAHNAGSRSPPHAWEE